MFRQLVVLFALVAMCSATSNLIAQENGLTKLTLRSLGAFNVDTNPMPGKVLVELEGASVLLIEGIAYTVSAVRGTSYYAVLAYEADIFLYGVDLVTGEIFIDRYSPNQEQIYVYGLTYDSKSDQLVGLSSIKYSIQSWFDVVVLNPTTGEISKNCSFGEFPDDSLYSGIYAFNQDKSELYVVFKQYTNATESTQEGMLVVDTVEGKVTNTVWFSGDNTADMNLYSLVYDSPSQMLYGSTATYVGTEMAFIKIDPSTGVSTLITNSTTVCGGNGPVIIDGLFISPGKDDVSSNTLYYVDLETGAVKNKYSAFSTLIEFLTVFST
eukprot:gene3493-3991_t